MYTFYTANALASLKTSGGNRKCEVAVLTSCGESNPRTERRKPNLRIHYASFAREGRVPYAAVIKYGLEVCRQFRPTVIHGQHFDGFYVASQLSAVCSAALVASFHNSPFGEVTSGLEYKDPRIAFMISAGLSSDKLVASCLHYKRELVALGLSRTHIKIVWPGLDAGFMVGCAATNRKSVVEKLRQAGLALPDYDHLILCGARIDPSKDLETFVRAAATLKARLMPNARLAFVIAGKSANQSPEEQAYQSQLEDMAKGMGIASSLFVTSFNLQEMCSLYKLCDVCVLPSVREAMGLVLIEAFTLGVPVVATNLKGISDVVVPDENAVVFPPRDHDELAVQIHRVLTDHALSRRIRQNAISTSKSRFSATAMGNKLCSFYRYLLNRSQ